MTSSVKHVANPALKKTHLHLHMQTVHLPWGVGASPRLIF